MNNMHFYIRGWALNIFYGQELWRISINYSQIILAVMSGLPLIERQRPIEEYLDRQAGKSNELVNLQAKGINYYLTNLQSDANAGLTPEQVKRSAEVYGRNVFAKKRLHTFFQFVCKVLEDDMLRILIVAAAISIVVEAIYAQDRRTFWLEGAAILLAVAVCTIVAATNDFQKQKQFQELNQISERTNKYDVIRERKTLEIYRDQIVVGDILEVKGGLEIPVDGLVTKAHDLIFDQSSMTGETHEQYKNTVQSCALHEAVGKENASPVILSGSKVVSGEGQMLVLIVGKQNRMGKLNEMIQNQEDDDDTPLEEKLQVLADKIGLFGLYAAIFVFALLTIRLLFSSIIPHGWNSGEHLPAILGFLILAVAIVVVAVPEGLPLAVTLSLAFSVKQMLHQNNLVRRLASCETMGSAHVICSDKTGTLTMNDMHVVQIWNGKVFEGQNFQLDSVNQHVNAKQYKKLIFEAIAHNSSAVLLPKQKGSPTQIAMIRYASVIQPNIDLITERQKYSHYFLRLPFNSDRKRITTGVTIGNDNYVFLSGASEIVLSACTEMYDVRNRSSGFSRLNQKEYAEEIEKMTNRGLRVVAIAVKKVFQISDVHNFEKDKFGISQIEKSGFTLLMLIGIQDLPRPQSKEAIRQCNKAGVVVIMVTGDNSVTARAVANELGITNPSDNTKGLCMEGAEFERLVENASPAEFYESVKHLKVLSRSRPEHKYKLVQGLKKINNVVAVTGDGTNDAPALLKADVGIAMGIAGTQIAKNAADILILDDNFNSIIRALVWGRNIYDSVKKFLQFQLTVNLVACILSVICAGFVQQSILTPVQMLWVNMIMDSLASLALATQPPNSEQLINRKPVNRSQGLVTKLMLKHALGQAIFQLTTLLILLFWGHTFLPEYRDEFDDVIGTDYGAKYNNGEYLGTMTTGCDFPLFGGQSYKPHFEKYHVYSRHFTFIFNTFVLMQIVNFFNCRKIHDELNMFKGMFSNYIFLLVLTIIFLFQWVIIYFLNIFFKVYTYHGLTIQHWFISFGIASIGIPVSIFLRLLPFGKDPVVVSNLNDTNDLQYRDPEQLEQCDGKCHKKGELLQQNEIQQK